MRSSRRDDAMPAAPALQGRRDAAEEIEKLIRFTRLEESQESSAELLALPPDLPVDPPPFRAQRHAPSTAIIGVPISGHEPLRLEREKHRPHGVRVGRRSVDELSLRDAVPVRKKREKDELVRGDAKRLKQSIGLSVHRPIRRTESHRDFVTRVHDPQTLRTRTIPSSVTVAPLGSERNRRERRRAPRHAGAGGRFLRR